MSSIRVRHQGGKVAKWREKNTKFAWEFFVVSSKGLRDIFTWNDASLEKKCKKRNFGCVSVRRSDNAINVPLPTALPGTAARFFYHWGRQLKSQQNEGICGSTEWSEVLLDVLSVMLTLQLAPKAVNKSGCKARLCSPIPTITKLYGSVLTSILGRPSFVIVIKCSLKGINFSSSGW